MAINASKTAVLSMTRRPPPRRRARRRIDRPDGPLIPRPQRAVEAERHVRVHDRVVAAIEIGRARAGERAVLVGVAQPEGVPDLVRDEADEPFAPGEISALCDAFVDVDIAFDDPGPATD